ncbi:hypothetical protein ONE63_008160 [Megalurothrips usitatus]|uniref:Uncharacterized protein n=1 Tax=Megalurothrips usitatus TaxID=439358 RepID=A0AAV7XPF0_9NEOP|nr:hypothetical protein ONE63_008160 [Megalurothrips usitatus]
MSSTTYSLVEFKDGKRRTKLLVLTAAIDGFKPASAEDIPNREYLVPWQDSFDDSLTGDHIDGRFPARILLVGASPEEIKAKAKALKIRLPSNWPLPSNETKKPMDKPLHKSRRKANEIDAEEKGKRMRMNETLSLLGSSQAKTSPIKSHSSEAGLKSSSPKETASVNSQCKVLGTDHTSKRESDATNSNRDEDPIVFMKTATSKSHQKMLACSDQESEKKLAGESKKHRRSSKKRSGSPSYLWECDADEADTPESTVAAKFVFKKPKEERPPAESKSEGGIIEPAAGSQLIQGDGKLEQDKDFSGISPEKHLRKSNQLSSPSLKDSAKTLQGRFVKAETHSMGKKSPKKSSNCLASPGKFIVTEHDLDCDSPSVTAGPMNDYFNPVTLTGSSSKTDDCSSVKTTGKMTRNNADYGASSHSSDDTEEEFESSGDDDATVLLAGLKKKHSLCVFENEQLTETIQKLKRNIELCKTELKKRGEIIVDLKESVRALQSKNQKLELKLQKSSLGVKKEMITPKASSSLVRAASSPLFSEISSPFSNAKVSPAHCDLDSPSSEIDRGLETTLKGPKGSHAPAARAVKQLFASELGNLSESEEDNKMESMKPDAVTKESRDKEASKGKCTLDEISKRIEMDLSGKQPLTGDKEKASLYLNTIIHFFFFPAPFLAAFIMLQWGGNKMESSENQTTLLISSSLLFQVYIGMGLHCNKKAWEKSIRTKKDDSKFTKEMASVIWGREKLMARTGSRDTSGKKACTPKKVELLHAALRGKMSARGESRKQQDFIIQNLAPKWLSEKCYDCRRAEKKPSS